ncbi:MAG: YbhB/YbcL family Raf kinase inhibitor-like protein [Planctomycetota bacterium]|nr:YbhB/YbcL family Raf kinase inhibitor-like protein [Planctomycetota bacterium]
MPAPIQLTSTAFAQGQPIPKKHTGEGADVSPPLAWAGAPAGAKAFALLVDDPDAPVGDWVHWLLYNIPATTSALKEGVTPKDAAGTDGKNSWGKIGYRGPMPPPGKAHRYFFKLYALDADLALPPGLTKKEFLQKIDGHVLAEGQLMGTYKR